MVHRYAEYLHSHMNVDYSTLELDKLGRGLDVPPQDARFGRLSLIFGIGFSAVILMVAAIVLF